MLSLLARWLKPGRITKARITPPRRQKPSRCSFFGHTRPLPALVLNRFDRRRFDSLSICSPGYRTPSLSRLYWRWESRAGSAFLRRGNHGTLPV
jgi:hypothetical protein